MNTKTKLLIITSVMLLLVTIGLYLWNLHLKKQIDGYTPQYITEIKIDTVYLEKTFTNDKPYQDLTKPKRVTIYTGGYEKDTSIISRDSIVQFKLDLDELDITLYNPSDSSIRTEQFKLELDKYKYLYSKGVLTQKKKVNVKFIPYIGINYRPIHQLADLYAGISLKTKYVTYSLGYDLGYYPKLTNQLQHDVSVSVTITF